MTWQAVIGTVRGRYISGTFGLVPAYRGTRLNIALPISRKLCYISHTFVIVLCVFCACLVCGWWYCCWLSYDRCRRRRLACWRHWRRRYGYRRRGAIRCCGNGCKSAWICLRWWGACLRVDSSMRECKYVGRVGNRKL